MTKTLLWIDVQEKRFMKVYVQIAIDESIYANLNVQNAIYAKNYNLIFMDYIYTLLNIQICLNTFTKLKFTCIPT